MERIYTSIPPDKIPWNIAEPPEALKNIVENKIITPCKVLELGCGTGNYLHYFARNGFDTTGVDFAETAINIARENSLKQNLNCNFIVSDVNGEIPELTGKFDFIYDWDLLHHIFPENRENYMKNVDRLLAPMGHYLSVCFSEDSDAFGGKGKYRDTPLNTVLYMSSEEEIQKTFEPFFEIKELKTIEAPSKFIVHKAVYAFAKKKD